MNTQEFDSVMSLVKYRTGHFHSRERDDVRQFFWVRFLSGLAAYDPGKGQITTYAKKILGRAIIEYIRMERRKGFTFRGKARNNIPEGGSSQRPLPGGTEFEIVRYLDHILPPEQAARRDASAPAEEGWAFREPGNDSGASSVCAGDRNRG